MAATEVLEAERAGLLERLEDAKSASDTVNEFERYWMDLLGRIVVDMTSVVFSYRRMD